MSKHWELSVAAGVALFLSVTEGTASTLIIAGFASDNILSYNVNDGTVEVVAALNADDRPRGIAVDADLNIYVALRGGSQNVLKLVRGGGGEYEVTSFTSSIGGFGPGLIDFTEGGELIVAGDASRELLRYDGATGELIDTFTHSGCCNIVGLLVDKQYAYAGEYFQQRILRFDLAMEPVQGEIFIPATDELDRPLGMTVGADGTLVVVNVTSTAIQEFSPADGAFIRTFRDLEDLGVPGAVDIHYEPTIECYFVSAVGDSVFQFDRGGTLLSVISDPLLRQPYGLAMLDLGLLCESDLDGNGTVGFTDLLILLALWGPCEGHCLGADIDGDGTVDFADLLLVLSSWGPCP